MTRILSIMLLLALLFSPSIAFSQSAWIGEVGTLSAVARVDEDQCMDRGDDGRCAHEAAVEALSDLADFMSHFRCVSASGRPNVVISPTYEKFTQHDSGPVIVVEARDLRCKVDPKSELKLVDEVRLENECSRLAWKCNVIWRPDYDVTTLFIGRMPR